MSRENLFSHVHKGLRAELYAAGAGIARADAADPAEATRAAGAVRRLIGFLEEHARHEDAHVLPALARAAPELHADLEAAHARLDGLHREALSLAGRLERGTREERLAAAARLHDRVVRLAAEHLLHMEREEQEAMPALWASHTDDELAALHARILASMPPARASEWLAVILPALSPPERAALVAGVRASVPPPALDFALGPARAALGAEWAATAAAAGL